MSLASVRTQASTYRSVGSKPNQPASCTFNMFKHHLAFAAIAVHIQTCSSDDSAHQTDRLADQLLLRNTSRVALEMRQILPAKEESAAELSEPAKKVSPICQMLYHHACSVSIVPLCNPSCFCQALAISMQLFRSWSRSHGGVCCWLMAGSFSSWTTLELTWSLQPRLQELYCRHQSRKSPPPPRRLYPPRMACSYFLIE